MWAWCVTIGIVAGLAAACGHPPPPHVAEPDDERQGAIELMPDDSPGSFAAEGELDAAAGDVVDWYTLTLFPDGRTGFDLSVDSIDVAGRLPASVEVFDGDAALLRRVEVKVLGHSEIAQAFDLIATRRVFVRIAAQPGTHRTRYRVAIQYVRDLGPPPPPPPPPCDPRAWDPHNPRCKDECNFADPDLGDVRCCKILSPCVHAPPDNGWLPCHARVTSIDGTRVRAAIGTADAGIAHLPAELLGDTSPPTLYDGRGNMITPTDGATPWLVFISADEHTSEWEFRTTRGHDMAWWQTHAQILEFRPPPVCR